MQISLTDTGQGRRALSINTSDRGGGAERIASQVHAGLLRRGWDSRFLVGDQKTSLPGVLSFYNSPHLDYRELDHGSPGRRKRLARHEKRFRQFFGLQDFAYPLSRRVSDIAGLVPDIIHFHNLHGGYFDLRQLPVLSREIPAFVTLEDCWWFSGHCVYPLECERWKSGCGRCPSLALPPEPKRRDATRWNWREKRSLFSRSRLYVAAPSQWLLDRARISILNPAIVQSRVIPHGVDLEVFRPGDNDAARRRLALPADECIVLFAANLARSNPYKDFPLIRRAAEELGASGRKMRFLAVGEGGATETFGNVRIDSVPFLEEPADLAAYYQAADLYLHAARNEAFGIVMAEAMACATPVIATAVDGIPEVLEGSGGGVLVPAGNVTEMVQAIQSLADDPEKRHHMGIAACEHAKRNFDQEQMIDRYEFWYEEVLQQKSTGTG